MRNRFVEVVSERMLLDEEIVFLTGDLGFAALEPIRNSFPQRFFNFGISEQAMVGVASGLSRKGFFPVVYSIGPFLYARALEQIRNDFGFQRLRGLLVGTGGGLGYGVMGHSHYSIDDIGTLSPVDNLMFRAPDNTHQIDKIFDEALVHHGPTYLRLAKEPSKTLMPEFTSATWSRFLRGRGPGKQKVILTVGPLAHRISQIFASLHQDSQPEVWSTSRFPISEEVSPPSELVELLRSSDVFWVIEDHTRNGGLGSQISSYLVERFASVPRMRWFGTDIRSAEVFGSEEYMQSTYGPDIEALIREVQASE